jgi:hypothetical protein
VEDCTEICMVFGREILGMGKKKLLGFLVIGKTLEKGTAKPMDLVLGNWPGRVNTWEPALCDGVEFCLAASGGFIGAAFEWLDVGRLVKVEETWEVSAGREVGSDCRSENRGNMG